MDATRRGSPPVLRHRFGALTVDVSGPLAGYEANLARAADPGRAHIDVRCSDAPPDDGDGEIVLQGGRRRRLEVRGAPGARWVVRATESVAFTVEPAARRVTAHSHGRALGFDDADILVGTVLPRTLSACGHTTLHAATALTPAGAVAVCGASGTGKSTIALALTQRGLPVLGDDAAVVDTAHGRIELWSCGQDLRLTANTCRILGRPPGRPLPRSGASAKSRHRNESSQAATAAHHLAAVVRLVGADRVERHRLRPAAAVMALRDNLLRIERSRGDGRARELVPLVRIAREVPVYEVRSPRTPETLDEVLDVIEDCAARP